MTANEPTIDAILDVVRQIAVAAPNLEANTPLLSSGIIDSLSTAEFVELLNKHFDTKLNLNSLGSDNADTATQIAALLSQA